MSTLILKINNPSSLRTKINHLISPSFKLVRKGKRCDTFAWQTLLKYRQCICEIDTKKLQKRSITQRLRTDLGRSVVVTIVLQRVWKNLFSWGKENSKFSVLKLIEIVIMWVYYTIPFGFSLFWHFLVITFQHFILHVWLRITDEGSVPEMRIWSIPFNPIKNGVYILVEVSIWTLTMFGSFLFFSFHKRKIIKHISTSLSSHEILREMFS